MHIVHEDILDSKLLVSCGVIGVYVDAMLLFIVRKQDVVFGNEQTGANILMS